MTQEYYLRIEAVNFDYSVHDTHDISTIRGGSFLILQAFKKLKALEKQEKAAGKQFSVLSAAASEAIVTFQANDEDDASQTKNRCLKAVKKDIEKFATVVSALLPKDGTDFQTRMEQLKAYCRWQQYQKLSCILPKREETAKKACDLDGMRPAIHSEGEKRVSAIVNIRRKRGRKLRNDLYGEILGDKDWFVSRKTEQTDQQTSTFVNDLNTLASDPTQGNLNGKIAFIYLDGNRFGRIRNQVCKDDQSLKHFQTYVQKKLRKPALKAILEDARKPENTSFRTDDGDIRLETLLWGGDEIEWVAPAWQAFNVLRTFFNTTAKIQKDSDDDDKPPLLLTHAGGVVFCHYKLPILQVRKYAKKLCEFAKQDIPKKVGEIQDSANRFAFLNMTAFDLIKGDVTQFLEEYHRPAQAREFILLASELAPLETHLRTVKTYLPGNKLFDIIEALTNAIYSEIDTILEKVSALLPGQDWERLRAALDHILHKNVQRWFVIADLIDYVGDEL